MDLRCSVDTLREEKITKIRQKLRHGMGSRDKMQGAISIELLFDTLGMNEVIQEKCEQKRNWPGLLAHVHLGVALVVCIKAVGGWSFHSHPEPDGAVRELL